MRFGLATLALLLAAAVANGQSCASYSRSYTPTYSYAPAVTYGTPTYYTPTYSYAAPAKTYKEVYKEVEYTPTYLRFILALPVANLPSYGAAYADPHGLAPAPQAAPAQAAKAQANDSLMQQIASQQGQILTALKDLDAKVSRLDERVGKLERTREPLAAPKLPQQLEQGPPPKEDDGAVSKAFAVVDAASCAACHRRDNAEKHGGGFVFSENDGRMAKLTADQREEVERQITTGKMPKVTSTRAKEASVKALTQQTADVLFRRLDRQKLATKRKEQAE